VIQANNKHQRTLLCQLGRLEGRHSDRRVHMLCRSKTQCSRQSAPLILQILPWRLCGPTSILSTPGTRERLVDGMFPVERQVDLAGRESLGGWVAVATTRRIRSSLSPAEI
jgi:hypothetical protein